jgi:hypothetical protein
MNLTDIIPSDLIDYAEEQSACKGALRWLREEPRTWRDLIDHNPEWAGWAAEYVFARRGDYEAADQLCDKSNWPDDPRGLCALEAVKRGDYDQAEQFCVKSKDPRYWRGQCAIEAAKLGDYGCAEQFIAESDNPEYWRRWALHLRPPAEAFWLPSSPPEHRLRPPPTKENPT